MNLTAPTAQDGAQPDRAAATADATAPTEGAAAAAGDGDDAEDGENHAGTESRAAK